MNWWITDPEVDSRLSSVSASLLWRCLRSTFQKQRFSSCRSISGGRCPCCTGRAVSPVLPWRRSWRFHSCSSLRNRRSWYSDCIKLWFFRSCSYGRRHLCRGAEAVSLGLAWRFRSCGSLTRCSTTWLCSNFLRCRRGEDSRVPQCSSCQFSGADAEKTVEIPQLQLCAVGLVTF